MMPVINILMKRTDGYDLHKSQEKISHLIYMDDTKLFVKNEKELETQIQAVRIYSEDIGMEFGIEKCVMLIMKRGKWYMTEGIELPNQEKKSKLSDKWKLTKTWDYWKQTLSSMNEKIKMNASVERKLLKTKLHRRNFIKRIKTCAAPSKDTRDYSLSRREKNFDKWTREQENSWRWR